MKAEVAQYTAEIELAALYQRRSTILALIHSMERYLRAPLRPAPRRSQRTFRCRPLRREHAK